MLTKAQQDYIEGVVARAGKPSAVLQRQIDQLRVAKTEDELREVFFRDADVARPKIEAELLCAVMLAKQVELNPSINAKSLNEEQHMAQTTSHKMIGLCPKCKSEVLEENDGYFCQARECGFKLGKVILGQVFNSSQAAKLLRDGRTDLLSEFVSKNGRQFPAWLVLDESGKVTFDFPKQDSHEIAELPKQAAARIVKTNKPADFLEKREVQSKPKEFFNLIKAIGIIALIFFGAVALLSKKHTGQAIEYTIIYTTINGQYYEKEGTAKDLNGDFVTFADGTRVPWADVKTKRMKVYPDELGISTNSNQ